MSGIVVAGTLSNYGPFMRDTPFSSLLNVEVFLAGLAVMTLSLAALASEYSVAEAQLRELVVTDPLTGLPNYRRLLEVLQMEIARADRHNRQFAVVFFDMDGLKRINDTVVEGLPQILEHANVIHQTGKSNFAETKAVADVVLRGSAHAERYHVFPYLSQDSLRAGATAITEIALWGKPAILIPIPESVSHDQRTNAYSYAHTGAAIVLEEENLTPNILASEIRRISGDPALRQRMGAQGRSFANPDAAKLIADELIRIGLSHLPQRPQA